jgi:hypothetical protein
LITFRPLTSELGSREDVGQAALYLTSEIRVLVDGAAFVIDGNVMAGRP